MKKLIIGLLVTIILLGGAFFLLTTVNFNRLNTDHYYVQITNDGVMTKNKVSTGEVFEQYEYTLDAYNEEGNTDTLDFTAIKQLRKNAYLKLFVNDEKNVKSYQEVMWEEIPKKAQLKFERK
ncbi:YxeA family protein [Psychrobacillus sp.]|uniref:YxeA family protein n=1 Tax=Psychrobacillus sp. TaxID=1871623 RepID=UPI0028BE67D5|nr:YxeA family protein [Psychrobacillus sp.]